MQRPRAVAGCLAMVATLSIGLPLHAQAPAGRTAFNTIYLELGGSGLIYSVNYERIMPQNFSLRAGFSTLSVSATSGSASADATVTAVPITASYLGLGSGSHKLEVGVGAALVKFSGSSSTGFGDEIEVGTFVPVGTAIVGYRFAPAAGGFNFRLAATPFYHPDMDVFPWGGLAFGFGF